MTTVGIIITLIIIGLLLIIAEVFLIPGIGISGLLGVASLAGASVYTFLEVGTTQGLVLFLQLGLRSKRCRRPDIHSSLVESTSHIVFYVGIVDTTNSLGAVIDPLFRRPLDKEFQQRQENVYQKPFSTRQRRIGFC